jgi:hypothetical protein
MSVRSIAAREMWRLMLRGVRVVWLSSLIWVATNIGGVAPISQAAEPPPPPDTSERAPLPEYGTIVGKVTQTMDVPQYTYVEIDTGKGLIWAAGPVTPVKVGDTVEVANGIPMINFHSTALDRTFENIVLAPAIEVK